MMNRSSSVLTGSPILATLPEHADDAARIRRVIVELLEEGQPTLETAADHPRSVTA